MNAQRLRLRESCGSEEWSRAHAFKIYFINNDKSQGANFLFDDFGRLSQPFRLFLCTLFRLDRFFTFWSSHFYAIAITERHKST